MKRTDLKTERGKITIHPKKLEAMKREARARMAQMVAQSFGKRSLTKKSKRGWSYG
jgi:ABC-type uncharacterized transport system ATPase component